MSMTEQKAFHPFSHHFFIESSIRNSNFLQQIKFTNKSLAGIIILDPKAMKDEIEKKKLNDLKI